MITDIKTDRIDWKKVRLFYVWFSLPILNCLRTCNKLTHFIALACLCGAAYTLLVTSTKINMRALHASFLCSCLQTRKILKNTYKIHTCYSPARLKFKSSCTISESNIRIKRNLHSPCYICHQKIEHDTLKEHSH